MDSVGQYLGVHQTFLTSIGREVNADYNFKTDKYAVECKKCEIAPDLEFYVSDDTKVTVSAIDYIRSVDGFVYFFLL